MSHELAALLTHARWTPATERARFHAKLRTQQPPGTLLVSTCHRVELYGARPTLRTIYDSDHGDEGRGHTRLLTGRDVSRQLITMAVGRDSSIVGEDQVLHQLRLAADDARRRGGLLPELDRLLDIALRAGRRARSWLPSDRPSLIDLALDRIAPSRSLDGTRVHVCGAGAMGRAAVTALLARSALVSVGSHTLDGARSLASRLRVPHTDFDPGASRLRSVDGVVVALAGDWTLSASSVEALTTSRAWLIDLSAPPALPGGVADAVGDRLQTIDDLATPSAGGRTADGLLRRLDGLIEAALAEYEGWLAAAEHRETAEALSERAATAAAAELEQLWRRAPSLDESQRVEVERAMQHVAERLLRDPLEQLQRDRDGSHARAARDLFRL